MIKIQATPAFIAKNKIPNFKLSLSNEEGGAYGISNSSEEQTGYVMSVPVGSGESLLIEDTVFQILIKNSEAGSRPDFLNSVLHYVHKGVINVIHVNAGTETILTPKQIITFTTP